MEFFTTYIYQPFFNILVGLYWIVGKFMDPPDMGVAVILFSVAVRIILLPIDLAGERSDEEKLKISNKIKDLKKEFAHDPVRLRDEIRKIMQQSPGAIVSEIVNIIIQFVIILMLYRIFKTGLEGEDMHLLYGFMPTVREPINLMFLGQYDLSQTNNTLNIIQSIMIALHEYVVLSFSPSKPDRKDFISLVIIFPIVCFGVFLILPAGKKVFIITSLAISIIIALIRQILFLYYSFTRKPLPQETPVQPQLVPENPPKSANGT